METPITQSAASSLDAFGNDKVQIPLPSQSLYILTQYTCSARRWRGRSLCRLGAIGASLPDPLFCLCSVLPAGRLLLLSYCLLGATVADSVVVVSTPSSQGQPISFGLAVAWPASYLSHHLLPPAACTQHSCTLHMCMHMACACGMCVLTVKVSDSPRTSNRVTRCHIPPPQACDAICAQTNPQTTANVVAFASQA